MPHTVSHVQLKSKTLQAFEDHIRQAEAGMERTLRGSFLLSDASPETAQQVRQGQTVAQFWSGNGPKEVPDGLIHDWIGGTFIPGTSLASTLKLIQDYDNHVNIYKPEVIASKLLSRSGNDFQIYLRLLKKKVIAVVLDTDHSVHYRPVDNARWTCHSYTTRIAEVENAGTSRESVLPPDTGYGFLWRLYSYWRFAEREDGVHIQCRAISLTRDVPLGLGWIIQPIIRKLPKESLIQTLECTRQALSLTAD